jgi:hypothetical protein
MNWTSDATALRGIWSSDMKTRMKSLGSRRYLVPIRSYNRFQFANHHPSFLTSVGVAVCRSVRHLIRRHRKHGCSRWNFVCVCSKLEDRMYWHESCPLSWIFVTWRTSNDLGSTAIELAVPENVGNDTKITSVSCSFMKVRSDKFATLLAVHVTNNSSAVRGLS